MARDRLLLVLLAAALLAPSAPVAAGSHAGGQSVDEPVEAVLLLDGPPDEPLLTELRDRGLEDLEPFHVADAVGVRATPAELAAARDLPWVEGLHHPEPLETNLAETRSLVDANRPYREEGATGANVTVAVVDSGIDADHPGFGDRVVAGRSFDESGAHRSRDDADGHGTHIAGIVAGSGARSEDRRLRGLAPAADLVGLDISDPFTTENALRAFEWIHDHHDDHGIQVVTNSWGRSDEQARYDPDDPLIRASNGLVQDGLVVVFSAGNKGPDGSSLTVEAMNPNVIAVGATDDQGHVAEYSSRGPAVGEDGEELPWTKPDLVAPGNRVTSTWSQDADDGPDAGAAVGDRWYATMNGTSMAAPHVAAVAALLLEERPTLTPRAVEAVLQASAADRGPKGPDPGYGHGLVNARTALRTLAVAEEGQVVVETRKEVPLEDDGEATGARGRVLADGQRLHAPPEDAVTTSFDVPDEATSANASFSWEDPRASFEVTLEGPDGERGPYRPGAGETTVWANVSQPEEGRWTLRAEPREPTRTGWTLGGHLTVLETRVIDGAQGVLAQEGQAPSGGGYFDEARGAGAIESLADALDPPSNPVRVGLAAASLLAGLVLRSRRE